MFKKKICIFAKKLSKMSTIDLKRSTIWQIIGETNDEAVLDAYHQILLNILKIQSRPTEFLYFDANNQSVSIEKIKQSAEIASKNVVEGRFVTHEEAKKQAQNW
jgi:hypothetical protein